MTSHNRRDNDPSKFTSKTPHFFKVILHETIRDGKLGIPRNFVRKHGNRLPSTIQLEVPSGATWKVEVTKCDEGVWLQKGWQEFAEHYTIKFGHFLVFRYEGNGYFHVLIFDKSASEIEYTYTNTEDDDEIFVGHCEDVSVSRKNKEKPNLPCPRPKKKRRSDSPIQSRTDLEVEILSSQFGADDPNSGRIKQLGNLKKVEKSCFSMGQLDAPLSVKTEVLSCKQHLTDAEKAHTLQIASAFKCTGNPVFMVVMRPYYVSSKYTLLIPSNFARKFLTMPNGNLTLFDSTGKTWPAKYQVRTENVSYMYGGWRAFAEDNNLSVGDVCVFQLIKKPEILLKVVIYPVVGNERKAGWKLADGSLGNGVKIRSLAMVSDTEPNCISSRQFKDPKIEENEIIEVLDDFPLIQKRKKNLTNPSVGIQANEINFNSANPSFTILMQPSYVIYGFTLHVPYQFAKRYFEENCELTLRVSDGRTWIVDYKLYCLHEKARFSCHGWRAFVVDNNLKVGDTCVFELVKENGTLLEVVIFPAAGCSSSKLGCTT